MYDIAFQVVGTVKYFYIYLYVAEIDFRWAIKDVTVCILDNTAFLKACWIICVGF